MDWDYKVVGGLLIAEDVGSIHHKEYFFKYKKLSCINIAALIATSLMLSVQSGLPDTKYIPANISWLEHLLWF